MPRVVFSSVKFLLLSKQFRQYFFNNLKNIKFENVFTGDSFVNLWGLEVCGIRQLGIIITLYIY